MSGAAAGQDPTIPHVTIDGVTFHAETFGDPANTVAIVVHGGPGADEKWRGLICESNWRRIVMNTRT